MNNTIMFVIIFLFGTSFLKAQEKITIERAIEIAVENNQDIQAKTLDIDATESLKKTAYELPKTSVNIQYGNNEGFEFNDGIMISQTIPFPSIFKAKKNLINEQVKGKELVKAISVNQLKQQVRSYFYQLEYLENNARILKSLDSIYVDFTRVAQLRYKTGDTKRVDISTAAARQGEINLLYKQNEMFIENAYRSLKTLLKFEKDFKIETATTYEPLSVTSVLENSLLETHPIIQSLYQEARIIEESKKVEKASGLPDFTLGYNNISLIGAHERNGVERYYNRGQRFSYIDVGVSIPISFGATKARIRSLDLSKQSIEATANWQKQQLQTQFQNVMREYEQELMQYNYFKEQALPNTKEIINAAKLGYQTGDISNVEYLYSLQTATDIHLNYLKSIQDINNSVITIYLLINQ